MNAQKTAAQLAALWWPGTRTEALEPAHGQRGKPSPESAARRARRNDGIAQAFSQLPRKGKPRRRLWEDLTNGRAQSTDEQRALINTMQREFGDAFKISGRHAERIWRASRQLGK